MGTTRYKASQGHIIYYTICHLQLEFDLLISLLNYTMLGDMFDMDDICRGKLYTLNSSALRVGKLGGGKWQNDTGYFLKFHASVK